MQFSDLSLSSELLDVVQELGFTSMTPIQEKAMPVILEGGDVIGQAKTGSGKTLAFTLPTLQKIAGQVTDLQRDNPLKCVVLCPTRELCTQVAREIRKLGRKYIGLKIVILTGGQPVRPQVYALEKGAHIVVGTPGRVLDHLKRKTLFLEQVTTLVLDEADRMLEMGFEEEMTQIMQDIPEERQTLLFSATFPKAIERISEHYQKNATFIQVADDHAETKKIDQYYCETEDKFKSLVATLSGHAPDSAIVFCNFKAVVTELTQELKDLGISASAIHGDLEQADRDSVMAKFRNKSIRVLVATDVAARGIDIDNLDLVVNYELPNKSEIYTHRIGRTGRAGKNGFAVAMILPKELAKIEQLQAELNTFITKTEEEPMDEESWESIRNELSLGSKMATLYIAEGRKHKMRPGDILGALTGDGSNIQGSEIGKIEIHDFFAYVAVSKERLTQALRLLQNGRIKGKKVRVEIAR